MHDNKIDGSTVAGRDIHNNTCPFQVYTKKNDEQKTDNPPPASDYISMGAMNYFIEKIRELELLKEIYMNAVVDCFYCMNVEDRTRISIKIMEDRKNIRGGQQ